MFNLAVASPSTNEAVMNACVTLAALNAEASIAVATSAIMEHIGTLWRSDPSSPASATGAAICQTASNMVPSACDALVQAGFSAAAASAACRSSNPECYLSLLIAFAADDSCVELMIRQGPFMLHLSGKDMLPVMQHLFGIIIPHVQRTDLAQRAYSPMLEKILSRLADVMFGVDRPRVPAHWCASLPLCRATTRVEAMHS